MKKLMTSTIILLPLLLLAIMLVSGAITSMITYIYVESVEFVDRDALVLVMEDEEDPPAEQLAVTILPLQADNRDLIFSVEDESIATVDGDGVVTAKFYGETYISVTSSDNRAATARRKVIVTDTSVHQLLINDGVDAEMYEGSSQQLSVTLYPQEAANKLVTWKSSDESILSVSANGTVTSIGAGTVTVTATSDDNGEAQDSVQITCHKKVTDLEVNRNLVVTSLTEIAFPAVTPVPADADVTYAYKTSDPSIATVDAHGNITFLKEGRVTVTVTATDFGGKTVEKEKVYTSTDGYFLMPLFSQKEYTFDFDEYYGNNKALPIPFAESLEGSFRKFVGVDYGVEDVLEFNETTWEFRFKGPMPAGSRSFQVTVTAEVYNIEEGAIEEHTDYFTLNVLRDAQSVAVAYKETGDAAVIMTAQNKLTFRTGGSGAGFATVNVFPANHTNAVSYALTGGAASITKDGVLTFNGAGEADVLISLMDDGGQVTAYKRVRVIYAPVKENQKSFEIEEGKPQQQNLLLSMNSGTDKEEGVLFFTEPAGSKTTYSVETGKDVVSLVSDADGATRIVPQKGGFATVKITVSPEQQQIRTFSLMSNESEITEYSFEVYIDRPVSAADLAAEFDGAARGSVYGTSAASVEFSAEIPDRDGSMAGKRLYVKYADAVQKGQESGTTLTGTIPFDAQGTLTVTFGVEYGDKAATFGTKGNALAAVTKTYTFTRDANEIKVSYGGTEPSEITVHEATFNFSTADLGGTFAKVTVLPADHTGTVQYALESGSDVASITKEGVLTFTEDGTAKVLITVLSAANGEVTAQKAVSVTYAYVAPTDKTIDLEADPAPKVLLTIDGRGAAQKGAILLTVPSGQTAEYTVESGKDVATLDEQHRIVPQKGGFAVVKVTLSDAAGEAQKEYTISVYVDLTVDVNALSVSFAGALCQNDYYTSEDSVAFTLTAMSKNGEIEGKRLFVTFGNENKKGTAGDAAFSGEIGFKDLGELTVTFGVEYDDAAKEYGANHVYNNIQRRILRNATAATVAFDGVQTTKIVTQDKTVRFGTSPASDVDALVTAVPSNHKNVISYVLSGEDGVASLTGSSLTFNKAGTVTVTVTFKTTASGTVTAEKEITVIYAPVGKNETAVKVGEEETKVLLKLGENATEGVIYFTEPEGESVQYTVTGSDGVVQPENKGGVWHIVPKKGGFATVEISFGSEKRTISVYVDKPVAGADLAVYFNENPVADVFTTSLTSVAYRVELTDKDGSSAGKQLYVSYTRNGAQKNTGNASTLEGNITGLPNTLTVTFGVEYGEAAKGYGAEGDLASVQRTVNSTNDALNALPTVTVEGGRKLNKQDSLEFANIGDEIKLTVGKDFSPADFVLTDEKITMAATSYVGVAIKDGVVTLTAKDPCSGESMTLSIKNQTFTLTVTVRAKADKVTVKFGEKTLEQGVEYKTLLSALTFNVTLSRTDNKEITNKNVSFTDGTGAAQTKAAGDMSVKIDGLQAPYQIVFSSEDGGASVTITIQKVELDDFGVEAIVNINGGSTQSLKKVESAKTANDSVPVTVPTDAQDTLTLQLTVSDDYLGGVGTNDEFQALFEVNTTPLSWTANFDAASRQIILTLASKNFHNSVTVEGGSQSVTLALSRVSIQLLEFSGFDSGNKANGGDVYKGFQQVRVFAKSSYYSEEDGVVKYFKVPYGAWADLQKTDKVYPEDAASLQWTLTRYVGDTATEEKTVQNGFTVTVKGVQYTIDDSDGDGKYLLKDSEGNDKTNDVTWIDPYTEREAGYARLYFGGFKGLSETDVQNDYFGNFDDSKAWIRPEKKYAMDSSSQVEPSEGGAFSFLRLEWGEESGKNIHFNFNVLDDASVVNVFNATGYLNNKKIVLHNNLYGEGEVEKVETPGKDYNADQFFRQDYHFTSGNWTTSEKVQFEKDLIYGNGYQVNLKAVNDGMDTSTAAPNPTYHETPETKPGMLNNEMENTAYGFKLGRLYNVTVKGTNAETKITPKTNRMLFNLEGAYYSTLQNYSKINPSGTNLYLKNTVMRYVANCAVQVWNATKSLYFENVVIDECLRAVSLEAASTAHFYFRGFTDVLNYCNIQGMKDGFGLINGGLSYARYFDEAGYPGYIPGLTSCDAKEYIEWFGSNAKKGKANCRYYANMAVTGGFASLDQRSTKQSHYWNDASSGYVDTQPSEQVGINFVDAYIGMKEEIPGRDPMMMGTDFSTYETKASVDGGTTTYDSRNWDLLFTNDRYIRLLCEYMDIEDDGTLIKNSAHIQWHMNKVHRNMAIVGDETNHIVALKKSLTDAINSHAWDGIWPDGSYLDASGTPHDPSAAALARMVSETVLPSKRSS